MKTLILTTAILILSNNAYSDEQSQSPVKLYDNFIEADGRCAVKSHILYCKTKEDMEIFVENNPDIFKTLIAVAFVDNPALVGKK